MQPEYHLCRYVNLTYANWQMPHYPRLGSEPMFGQRPFDEHQGLTAERSQLMSWPINQAGNAFRGQFARVPPIRPLR